MGSAIALAFGLAMDAAAVSAVRGLQRAHPREWVLLPILFGVFQAKLAALGWLVGRWGGPFVEAWDHWIGFGLLVVIGGKMIVEARRHPERELARGSVLVYLGLAIATSIDAAAAGLTLPMLPVAPEITLAWIGGITFACSLAAYSLGRVAGARLGPRLEVIGGVVLIVIGLRLLLEHLASG